MRRWRRRRGDRHPPRAGRAAGRAELANDLAMALMNKGNALARLGRLDEAVSAYDEAIAIYRELVERGRAELANDLAMALMNKGDALDSLGQLPAAVTAYDEAIAILRGLVEQGRAELANDLARALMHKALVLEKQEQRSGALACYEDAIRSARGVHPRRDEPPAGRTARDAPVSADHLTRLAPLGGSRVRCPALPGARGSLPIGFAAPGGGRGNATGHRAFERAS